MLPNNYESLKNCCQKYCNVYLILYELIKKYIIRKFTSTSKFNIWYFKSKYLISISSFRQMNCLKIIPFNRSTILILMEYTN